LLVDKQEQGFEITADQWGWISSLIGVGAAISCIPIGYLMNWIGRKWAMLVLVIPFLIGWALLIWAVNVAMMIAGRLLLGLAGGAFCISAPLYSAEIAEKEIRGIIGTFFQLLINAGILFVYCIGPYIRVLWTNVICALVVVVFALIMFFMPESPVHLVRKDRTEEAIKSYKWLRGSSYDPQSEIDEILAELEEDKKNQVSFSEVIKYRSSKMAMFIGFGLAFFQQMSGINVVIFFATRIFAAANVQLDPNISTIITGAVNLVFTAVASSLVDRLGRRLLLLVSIILMTLCTTSLGIFFFLQEQTSVSTDNLGWLPLTSLCLFLVGFALGYGPIVWLMIGEVYSKELAKFISPFTGSFNWFFAFAITFAFQPLSTSPIGIGGTFWIFAGASFIGIIWTFFIIPETKGKSMSEIQRMLSGEKNIQD
jgi:SP family facilitated glucose transporter-like MFS transporter 8